MEIDMVVVSVMFGEVQGKVYIKITLSLNSITETPDLAIKHQKLLETKPYYVLDFPIL